MLYFQLTKPSLLPKIVLLILFHNIRCLFRTRKLASDIPACFMSVVKYVTSGHSGWKRSPTSSSPLPVSVPSFRSASPSPLPSSVSPRIGSFPNFLGKVWRLGFRKCGRFRFRCLLLGGRDTNKTRGVVARNVVACVVVVTTVVVVEPPDDASLVSPHNQSRRREAPLTSMTDASDHN